MKEIKCAWCKESLPQKDAFVYEYVGRNGKMYDRKGHKQCFMDFVERKQRSTENAEYFYKVKELLMKVYSLSEDITGVMYNSIVKNLYSKKKIEYVVIYNAIKLCEDALYKNLDKPWNYHFAIIQNYITVAQTKVENERRVQIQRELYEREKEEEIVIKIIKPTEEKPTKSVLDKKVDISTL